MRLAGCLLLLAPISAMADEKPRLSHDIFVGRIDSRIRRLLQHEANQWIPSTELTANIDDEIERQINIGRFWIGGATYDAVLRRGLSWLARHQLEDGSWVGDGTAKNDSIGVTSLAVLAFTGIDGWRPDGRDAKVVDAGISYLLLHQKPDGSFGKITGMEGHSWATIALVEASILTNIEGAREGAADALGWLVKNQCKDGSWGVTKGKLGPAICLAWPVQAVWLAKTVGYQVPTRDVFRGVTGYLDSRTWDKGQTYGLAKDEPSPELTAAAPMIRLLTGTSRDDPAMRRAFDAITRRPVSDKNPVLYQRHFFETQFLHAMGGQAWKTWERAMRASLYDAQYKEGVDQNPREKPTFGSWSPDAGELGEQYGKHGSTAMSLLTLEVYFRYLPPGFKLAAPKREVIELER
ncbi:prenyltransferase/squalene oxidase repeat-containing protein [Zavarzinella formosa]|uniref:prenyltransferase/squalene oxidase repeat-containing protein n=1 Tax=Zavarzinella formosa TaxID=360055 RepID=UPI0002EC4677|nr:prenyltransferase/squalene oxidase repeat-containing protein [Zavarzinella formosa]